MKRRISILAGLTFLTVFTAYASGRWGVLFLIPPEFIPAFLTLLAAFWLVLPCRTPASVWRRWLLRGTALVACWVVLRLPSYWGSGYFEMGLQAHIRSTFTPALIQELRAAASRLVAQTNELGMVELKAADLPAAAVCSGWGMPGHAACYFDKQGRLTEVRLIWGSALISHHGLVISDEEIPFHGTGFHITEHGEDMVYYPERYYPLHPGSYIFIDEN